MDEMARAYYQLRFHNNYLQLKGNAFQDFFSEIMERRYPGDFIRTRPWGNVGDRKNDGYLGSKRTLFQVYAPNELSADQAVRKIEEDFNGALPYWRQYFDTWVFVHNSQDGLGPDVVNKLLELSKLHTNLTVKHWGRIEIEQEVRSLGGEDLCALFGYVPTSDDMLHVGFEELKIVLNHITEEPQTSFPDLRPPSPEKLKFNDLSEGINVLLLAGMTKSDQVKKFFSQYSDPLYGDRVVEAFRKKYEELKTRTLSNDLIFMELRNFASGGFPEHRTPAHEVAVLVVLAYLFESCDIFERA